MEKIKYVSQKEIKKLFRVIEKQEDYPYKLRDLVIFHLGYYCALRVSELGLLQVGNFNRTNNEIYCKRLKGSNNNTIRLDEVRTRLLKQYIKVNELNDNEDLLFPSKKGNPISDRRLQQLATKYMHDAKWSADVCHFHTLRHSMAVHLAESSLDVKELQYWLGHKNINNTIIYFQFTTTQQESMYQKLSHGNALA